MKLLKFLSFLSILGGIFLVIYRQSDSKGLIRWWKSFKVAVVIAGILAGLISNSTAIEPHLPNNSPSIEKVLSNQEFNLLEENDRQVSLNTSLTNEKSNFSEEEVKALEISNQTILVKGVDGFSVNPTYPGRRPGASRTPSHSSKPPRAPSGFYRMPAKPVKNQGVHGGATGLGGSSGSGSGSPGDDSNPNNPSFNTESSNQCQDPSYYSQPKKSIKKNRQKLAQEWLKYPMTNLGTQSSLLQAVMVKKQFSHMIKL